MFVLLIDLDDEFCFERNPELLPLTISLVNENSQMTEEARSLIKISKILAGLLAVALMAQPVTLSVASAAGVSFAEAWRLCKAELDREHIPSVMTSNDRYLRGGACMRRYGYHF